MIYLLFGQPGAGKTTLGKSFAKKIHNSIHIDGDSWREVTDNKDYSRDGRIANFTSACHAALYLEKQGFVPIMSFVAPYQEMRDYLVERASGLRLIYLFYAGGRGKDGFFVKDFEPPVQPPLFPPLAAVVACNTSTLTEAVCLARIERVFL